MKALNAQPTFAIESFGLIFQCCFFSLFFSLRLSIGFTLPANLFLPFFSFMPHTRTDHNGILDPMILLFSTSKRQQKSMDRFFWTKYFVWSFRFFRRWRFGVVIISSFDYIQVRFEMPNVMLNAIGYDENFPTRKIQLNATCKSKLHGKEPTE